MKRTPISLSGHMITYAGEVKTCSGPISWKRDTKTDGVVVEHYATDLLVETVTVELKAALTRPNAIAIL